MIKTKADLIEQIEKGREFEYIYFWGHTPKQKGVADKSCLSQWFPAKFKDAFTGRDYATAEHAMMYRKAMMFGDYECAEKILDSTCPREAKKLGRQVKGFIPHIWDNLKYLIVETNNIARFKQNPDLLKFLLSTGDKVLVEASPYDKIWGIGMGIEDARKSTPMEWRGENLLGFALMGARFWLTP